MNNAFFIRFSALSLLLLCQAAWAEDFGYTAQRVSLSQHVAISSQRVATLAPQVSPQVAKLAAQAASCAMKTESVRDLHKLAIIDYSLPSRTKRFWLLDLARGNLLIEDYVAHGKNTGDDRAMFFSNRPGSLQSSIGVFGIGPSYIGKHGTSLRLLGLEPGFNDLAYERAIVMHGADYVHSSFIQKHRRLGRSFGCPALSRDAIWKVINALEAGDGILFSYYPDEDWLKRSQFLNSCQNS